MSKTGGGRGTNQHKVRGVSSVPNTSRAPEVELTMSSAPDWDAVLSAYPTVPTAFQAIPEPHWDDLTELVAGIAPKGVARAIARFNTRQGTALYNDAQLEGITYTEPEIVDIIGGTHVPGYTEGEEQQVTDMVRASAFLMGLPPKGRSHPIATFPTPSTYSSPHI